jgi:hypothetical protein
MSKPWRRRDETGSTSMEAAIVLTAFMVFILIVIAAGRVSDTRTAVKTAAAAGARAASLERSAGAARSTASDVAAASLNNDGVACNPSVSTSTGGFSVAVGQPAQVSTTVRCSLRLGDLLVPGLPGSVSMAATRTSVLDRYRERAGGFMILEGLSGGNSGGN